MFRNLAYFSALTITALLVIVAGILPFVARYDVEPYVSETRAAPPAQPEYHGSGHDGAATPTQPNNSTHEPDVEALPPVTSAAGPSGLASARDLLPYGALFLSSVTAFSGVYFGWRKDRREARDLELRTKEMEGKIRELEQRLSEKQA